ncbi:signal peptide peptidase SppA [Hymenobacter sp. RP-2-7]|uniref:Signal peptide peptidase SppA n=1 Tax=Hymenobacter polaris TaxID=2682546 RepID=A0A7Y0FM96_9BACT|nr:signal peptide peptidase SppA [Hymenobacter polaris]NML65295.1 signal peptide peptidase SppA [Hymenobacter polaris]
MRQFFKFVLATVTGLVLFSALGFVLLLGLVAAAKSVGATDKEVASNSVLELRLDKPITERQEANDYGPLGGGDASIGLLNLRQAIAEAKKDDNIKGILLRLESVQGGLASLTEVRDALLDFKKSGKFVVSYSQTASEKSYFLASVADQIYLHPQGRVEFNGLSAESPFFKGLLDKSGIEVQVFRVGSFKSAVEPFIRTSFSDSARAQEVSYLNSINDDMLRRVAASRKIAVPRLHTISDSMLVHNGPDALRLGLVTKLGYYDEVLDYLRGKLGTAKDKKPSLVSLSDYHEGGTASQRTGSTSGKRIAVIYAEGDIVDGNGSNSSIGGDKFAEAIRKARLDDKVKAVVLRVNSPGGSSLASDVMYREVLLTSKVKPIIASMGDVAASGGYYISMACDTIVAQPNTITGSIGVFGLLPNIQQLLADKLGITTDRVETGKFSDFPTITRPLTAYEKQQFQAEINDIYADFTSKAALGRHMPVERLRRLASGRVWSGSEAKARGLVDVLGSYDAAVQLAARAAHLSEGDYSIQRLPRQKTSWERLLSRFGGDDDDQAAAEARLIQSKLGPLYPVYRQYQTLLQMKGVQARLPYELELK